MNCREFASFLDAYVAESLAREERESFDRHLAVCRDCQNYLSTYRTTVGLCQTMRDESPVPADVPEDLVKAILQSRRPG